jgi:hypothetical protein
MELPLMASYPYLRAVDLQISTIGEHISATTSSQLLTINWKRQLMT